MFAGFVAGSLFGKFPAFAGGLSAAIVGLISSTVFVERKGIIRDSAWNGVARLSFCGLLLGMVAGYAIGLGEPVLYFAGIPVAGFGAMLGNYLDHFFDYDRPPKIF